MELTYQGAPPLYAHQEHGIEELCKWNDPAVGRIAGGCFMLADEQGAGKTRQVTEAACRLFEEGAIDQVVIIAEGSAAGPVWFDPELGQLIEYTYVSADGVLFRPRRRHWQTNKGERALSIVVTNYEYIRREPHLKTLLAEVDDRTLLVVDESFNVKSHTSKQTKAVLRIRKRCGRVWLLNGTPIAESPGDLYAQCRIMDDSILGCKTWWEFRARYAIMKPIKIQGRTIHQIVGWTNLDDLTRRLKPYVLRRLKVDCMDLPPKLPPVAQEVALTKDTWKLYQAMLKDSLVYLDKEEHSVAPQAITRIMRLVQLTSGFLGGVVTSDLATAHEPEVREVGREKLEWTLNWVESRLEEDPVFRAIFWCRFRAEAERLDLELATRFPNVPTALLLGQQSKADRQRAMALLHPKTVDRTKPGLLSGTTRTGRTSHNFAGAATVAYLSNDHSLFTRSQSEERVHRAGQDSPVNYLDVLATGPDGQKTVDHVIQRALRRKQDTASWTCGQWATELRRD